MANWHRAYLDANPHLKALPEVKRARHSVHFRRPDGLIEAHFTGAPAFYQDGNSAWQELDTTLQDGGTYWHVPGTRVRVAKANRKVTITDGVYTQTTSRVGLLNPTTGAFRALWSLPVGTVIGDSVVASGNGYEYRLRVTENGLRETLTLASNPGSMGAQPGEWLVVETTVEGKTFPDGWVDTFAADAQQFPMPTTTDAAGNSPECKRYAKIAGGTQYLYTGVLAAWFPTASYPVVIDPDFAGDAGDGWVQGYNADYATARSTGANTYTSNEYFKIGRDAWSGNYRISRAFIKFDTSTIADTDVVYQANLKLTTYSYDRDTAFEVQVVDYQWSAGGDTDYDGILAASLDVVFCASGDLGSYNTITGGALNTASVSKTGFTYYGLRTDRDYDNISYTQGVNEYAMFSSQNHATSSYRPVLVVLYRAATASGDELLPTVTATTAATSPYDDDDWITPSNVTANDAAYAKIEPTAAASSTRGANNTLVTTAATAPYDDLDWGDKTGVNADDADLATITSASFDSNVISYLAKAQGFGFTIPATAVITGIQVAILRARDAGTSAYDACVQLLDASGALFGDNKAATATNWPSSLTTATYGGSSDMWGLSTATLTPAVVNDADFGVGLAVKAGANNVDISVDYIGITVYYSDPTFDSGEYSYLLKASSFPFGIPSAATINGVEVKVERKAPAGTIKDATVKLLGAAGTVIGDDKADTATAWPSTDTVKTYGGASDVWGATLTPAVVNDPDFGVAIAVTATANDSTAYIDYVSMAVYYSTGPGYSPSIGDTVAVGDTPAVQPLRVDAAASDAIAVGEVVQAKLVSNASVADSVTVGETPAPSAVRSTANASVSQSITVAETPAPVATPSTAQASVSDTVTVGETPAPAAFRAINAQAADTVTVGETPAPAAFFAINASVSDAIGVTDTPAAAYGTVYAQAADAVAVGETPIAGPVTNASVSDAVAVGETPAPVAVRSTAQATAAETINVGESVAAYVVVLGELNAQAADNVTVTDTPSAKPATANASVSDSVTVGETPAPSAVVVTSASVSDSIAVGETPAPSALISTPQAAVADSIGVTDTPIAKPATPQVSIADSIGVTDTPVAQPATPQAAAADSIAVGDAPAPSALISTPQAIVADSITVGETPAPGPLISTSKAAAADSIGVTDTPAAYVVPVGEINASDADTIAVAEATGVVIVTRATAADTVTVSDTPAVQPLRVDATASDTIAVGEATGVVIVTRATAADTVTVSDTPAAQPLRVDAAVSDTIAVAEAITALVVVVGAINASVADYITVDEAVAAVLTTASASVADAIAVAETTDVVIVTNAEAADTVTVADSADGAIVASVFTNASGEDAVTVSDEMVATVTTLATCEDAITIGEELVVVVQAAMTLMAIAGDTITITDVVVSQIVIRTNHDFNVVTAGAVIERVYPLSSQAAADPVRIFLAGVRAGAFVIHDHPRHAAGGASVDG